MTRSYKHIEKYEEVKPSIKYNIINRHKDKYAISVMCKFFNISRSGYYGYISRMNTPHGIYHWLNKHANAKKNAVKSIPKSNTNKASLTVLSSIVLNNSLRIIP